MINKMVKGNLLIWEDKLIKVKNNNIIKKIFVLLKILFDMKINRWLKGYFRIKVLKYLF